MPKSKYEASKNAIAKYNKTNMKRFGFVLNMKTEADIIEHLETKDNKNGYIKQLIIEDIARSK